MPTNRLIVKEQVATYAQVLFDAANDAGGQDSVLEVREQLKQIVALIREDVDLQEALKDTGLTAEQRESVARGVFAQLNAALVEVLAVMAGRNEIDLLTRVQGDFEKLLGDKLNLCVVDVTTAVELDDHLRELIKEKAAKELGKNIVLNERVDKSILGGVIMSANGERIDASISSQIENARETLKHS